MNAGARATGALALSLSGAIALEWAAGVPGRPAAEAVGVSELSEVAPPPVAQPHGGAKQVEALLARPLFSPGRRPPPPAAPAVVQTEPPPRLAGTLVGPFGKRAVFAGAGKLVSAGEGDSLGAWMVRAITAGSVVLARPEGWRELHVAPMAGPDHVGTAGSPGNRPFWSNPCGRPHKRRGGGAAISAAEECRAALAALAPSRGVVPPLTAVPVLGP